MASLFTGILLAMLYSKLGPITTCRNRRKSNRRKHPPLLSAGSSEMRTLSFDPSCSCSGGDLHNDCWKGQRGMNRLAGGFTAPVEHLLQLHQYQLELKALKPLTGSPCAPCSALVLSCCCSTAKVHFLNNNSCDHDCLVELTLLLFAWLTGIAPSSQP